MEENIMALIQCPECRKNVSETAETCPNCGFNIKKHVLKEKMAIQEKKTKEARTIYETKKSKLIQEYGKVSFQPPNMTKSYLFIGISAFFVVISVLLLLIIFEIIGDGSHPVGIFIMTLILAICTGLAGINSLKDQKKECDAYKNDPENYRNAHAKHVSLTPEQNREIEQKLAPEYNAYRNELAKLGELGKQLNPQASQEIKQTIPRCPHCHSPKIRPISTANRVASVAAIGLASGKIGKQFECLNCKFKW